MDYALRPEVPGHLGPSAQLDYSQTPYRVVQFDVELDGWMGDELCATAGNNYFVSERLKESIKGRQLTGCTFGVMTVTRSDLFEELEGTTDLPEFSWLKVHGQQGKDDFAIGAGRDGVPTLVVSSAALDCLRTHTLRQCEVVSIPR